jgi:hypothetical protein
MNVKPLSQSRLPTFALFYRRKKIGVPILTFYNRVNNLSAKGQMVNILNFVGHMVSVETPQICLCSVKAIMSKI